MLNGSVRFGPFEANLKTGELRREAVVVPIQDVPFRVLAALLARPGELVTRAELTAAVWGSDTFVDATAGLNTAVAKLREALGDQADRPEYIETVPKRGYRYIGPAPQTDSSNLHAGDSGGAGSRLDRRRPRRRAAALALVAAVAGIAILAAYELRASRSQVRVAVALFDNETGRAELDRLAQELTDATVFALTAQPKLAVVGNAAILRTSRPFRDLAAIRDALHADFVVIGQVQLVDGAVLVRAHLIRAGDQAHVWVSAVKMTAAGEEALQSAVVSRIAEAVAAHARAS
jgi:DNA-binding winged helix-turn-helix (wHTH) protein/TolB-like protein